MRSILRAATEADWQASGPAVSTPGAVYVFVRGPERIEVQIGNGGLPNKVIRTTADGEIITLGQTYFRMAEIVEWMKK